MTDLTNILRRGEDSKTQFKLSFKSTDALAAEISAMANGQGGQIVVGVSDSGNVEGVQDLPRLNNMISNACSQKIEPPLSVETQNYIENDRLVVLINIPLGPTKPYIANKRDYWIKVGADKRRATREELKRLMQASGGLFADEMILAQTSIADIDRYGFTEFFERTYGMQLDSTEISMENALCHLKLMAKGNLSLAGLLLFGKGPERLVPQFQVKGVAFAGTDKAGSVYLDSEDIGGPLPLQFKDSMAFLKRNLHKRQQGQSFNTTGILEIPPIALEEAVVNALVHRDYFINAGVRLFIFEDRIEIISPGSLPNTVTTDNIRYGIQIVRNPILVSFLGKLDIPYRGIGSGILRMIRECRQAGVEEPEFIENKEAGTFSVVFQRPRNT